MDKILPSEPMDYKQQIKQRGLLTKLRIIRLVKKGGYSQIEVAKKFHCHRNTIGNIIRKYEKEVGAENKEKLLHHSLSLEEIRKLLVLLENKSRVPKSNNRSASRKQEEAVVEIFNKQRVKVGPYRMRTVLKRKFGKDSLGYCQLTVLEKSLGKLKVGSLKGIYKRNSLKIEKKRSASKKTNPLYDYRALACFERLHYDTKEITDKKTLPQDVYAKFKSSSDLPTYEYNLIDAKSRFRLIAFSRHLNSEFGLKFLLVAIQFIRAKLNNWNIHIRIGADNGKEFCSGSERKEENWNSSLKGFNVSFYSYHPRHDIRKNLIERSHKTDDYEFFIPRGEFINTKQEFIKEANDYFHYFNFQRSHSGKGMGGRTPFEVIRDSGLIGVSHLSEFQVIILEDQIKTIRESTDYALFTAEVEEYRESNKKLDKKTLIDLQSKYDFFDPKIAQNVLTYYPRRLKLPHFSLK